MLWSEEIRKEFELCLLPSLILPNPLDELVLQTDASSIGIGAVLNVQREGNELPVAFYSRKPMPSERWYGATELQGLAVVDAVEHFSAYLVGQEFTVETDHKALTFLHSTKYLNARLARRALRLQTFSFTIRYQPGPDNINADTFSRQEWPEEEAKYRPRPSVS